MLRKYYKKDKEIIKFANRRSYLSSISTEFDTINWKKDNLDKYFDNIYTGLSDFYISQQKYEAGLDVLNEGLKIAENNYENLYFKNAYSEFLTAKMLISMM